ncbi:hypothetical protein [Thiomonas sp.]|jgi:hypothetical protein|uniref:hypothetical protein n=1 Tax=Thiomonas sp. TaxID=2047785 RepID=UPI002625D187|nr:hypothetical protein [Thiomonas sp.]
MPGKLPPPQANVDNVLPGLLEDIRKRREAGQGDAVSPPRDEPAPVARAGPAAAPAPAPGELEELRSQLKQLRRLVGLALAIALALAAAWLGGWRP